MTTDRDGRTTIPPATWSRLLAPDSGLITQSDTLRTALASMDGYTITIELRALHHGATEQDRRALDGLALFLRHTAARHRDNHHAIATTAAEATTTDMRRADLHDLRRLGALVIGLARGRLPADLHTEVTDLAREKLGPAEARHLTTPIRRGHRTPRATIRTWLRRRSHARRGTPVQADRAGERPPRSRKDGTR